MMLRYILTACLNRVRKMTKVFVAFLPGLGCFRLALCVQRNSLIPRVFQTSQITMGLTQKLLKIFEVPLSC
jgi:hypothetical protein